MKKDKFRIISLLLVALIVGVIAYLFLHESKIDISSISLNEHLINVFVGDSKKLEVVIAPENATDKTVIWESSNPGVASVSSDGTIVGNSSGEAIITVRSEIASDKCIVKVIKKEADILELTEKDINIRVNDTKELSVNIDPIELKDLVSWESSNEGIVSVDSKGIITGVSNGTATVKAIYGDKESSCEVRVSIAVESIIIENDSINLDIGKTTELKLIITPAAAANQEITWSSSDSNIVSVDKGVVKALGEGTAVISATVDNKTANSRVTVTIPVESIKLNKTSISLDKGQTENLVATISPSNVTNKKITWTSSNEKIATVDSNGKVTGIGTGTATITATVGSKTATCKVKAIGYVITKDSKFAKYSSVASYDSATLKYRILRTDSDYTIVWVLDAYKQWNSALPSVGKAYKAENLLSYEINTYGYQKKGLVAVNGGFFWDGWGDSPCVPFILNKGKIVRDIENKNYNKNVYGVFGLTKNLEFKTYSFKANDYEKNKKSRQQMLDDGVRNSFSVTGYVISPEGKLDSGTDRDNHNVFCQVDENNYVLYSGSLSFSQIAYNLKNTYNCRVAINFDGGGSRKLYYKTGSMSSAVKVFGGGRAVPDMMYFVEQ